MSRRMHPTGKFIASIMTIGGPLAVLLTLRFVLGSWTDQAPASMQNPIAGQEDLETPLGPPVDLAAQRRAMDWLAKWKSPTELASAFNHPLAPKAADTVDQDQPAPPVAASPREVVPAFSVSAIMSSNSGGMATVNGKVYRIGDEPAPGWRIRAIDHHRKMVELVGPSNQVIHRSPPESRRKTSSLGD